MKSQALAVLSLSLFLNFALRAQDVPASANLSVWLPGKPWALEIAGAGFTTQANEIQPDGRRYFLAENQKTHIIVSVFLEPSKAPIQPGECKRSLEEKVKRNSSISEASLRGVSYRESAGMDIVEFSVAEADGMPTNQRSLFACLINEDVFVDIHISKMFFRAADQSAFDALLQSIHFVAKEASNESAPVGNSAQLFQEGSRYFLAHQYREAIAPYQRAFEIEKITPTLEKNLWRVLIDNLSMAYGITGELTLAKETLTYGVSKDSEYPLFYYNLACVAAQKGDMQDTEGYLKLAFERRNNLIPGETFPNARVDDSFQKLLLQREFRQFVDALYGPQR